MKHLIVLIIALYSISFASGQNTIGFTEYNISDVNNKQVDTVELNQWRYKLEYKSDTKSGNKIKPIALLSFVRMRSPADILSKKEKLEIKFEIYNLSDSNYCFEWSSRIKTLSSCRPPLQGGDCIKLGKFILLNSNVCVNCSQPNLEVDECRPIVRYVLNHISNPNIDTFKDLVKQFVVEKFNQKN